MPLLSPIFKRLAKARRAGQRASKSPILVPKSFAKGIGEKDVEKAYRGHRTMNMRQGSGSLIGDLLQVPADKIFGKKRARKALWEYAGKPALVADTAVGNVLSKTPLVGKKLFKVKEKVPWGKGLYKDIERSSALGPLSKARDIAEPLVVGVGLERGIRKLHELQDSKKNREANVNPELREKVASTMLHLHQENKGHQKRAHALKLLYKQAEMGYTQVPQSFGELEEKLASLINQDLVVLEKAMELAGGQLKLGELGYSDPKSLNASEQFQAAILE